MCLGTGVSLSSHCERVLDPAACCMLHAPCSMLHAPSFMLLGMLDAGIAGMLGACPATRPLRLTSRRARSMMPQEWSPDPPASPRKGRARLRSQPGPFAVESSQESAAHAVWRLASDALVRTGVWLTTYCMFCIARARRATEPAAPGPKAQPDSTESNRSREPCLIRSRRLLPAAWPLKPRSGSLAGVDEQRHCIQAPPTPVFWSSVRA